MIALLVALGGLALPALVGRVAGSTAEAVETRIAAAAALCRADAQRRGKAVEFLSLERAGRTMLAARPVSETDQPGETAEILMELPQGYSVGEAPPSARSRVVEGSASGLLPAGPAERILAVFRRDGSSSSPGERYLSAAGKVRRMGFAKWSGRLTLSDWEPEEEVPEAEMDRREVPSAEPSSSGAQSQPRPEPAP